MGTVSSVEGQGATSLLGEVHEGAGARFQEGAGEVALPRHYGDPASEYEAAMRSCAVTDRSHRARWRLEGRDPARMLDGIVTNTIPSAPREVTSTSGESHDPAAASSEDGAADADLGWRLLEGRAPYGLTLTAKGKVVSDHRLIRLAEGEDDVFLLDLPAEGVPGMEAHFERFLPPRFATVVDESGSTGMLSVVGPEGGRSLATALAMVSDAVDASELTDRLAGLAEGELLLLLPPGGEQRGAEGERGRDERSAGVGCYVVRSDDLGPAGSGAPEVLDVVSSRPFLQSLWESLREGGCSPLGRAAWETLRVEGGRPAFGVDMDDDTIPVEAGVHDRAIDYEKGCYTGQEVIVRIRDRGRVNRHLRRLLLGDRPTPAPGTELFRLDGARAVGWITSAMESPRFGQTIALGYVRRELEPPARVRLASAEGTPVEVRTLADAGTGRLEEEGEEGG